ncbi:MAG: SDR family NAD(P)-dependent oxidoreductase [Patescibacteria group bacterium]
MVLNNKKVFITGGGGFIGTHIAKNLSDKGFKVRLFDLDFGNYNILSEKLGNLSEVEKIKGDIFDLNSLTKAMAGSDYVIHAAAMLGVRNTELKKLGCLNINILGTINVLEACVKERVKRIIFTSSSEVYGEPLRYPIEENDFKRPVSLYGVSKLAGEEYMKAYNQKYGLEFSIIRFFNVYGPGQVAEFVMPRFIKNVLEDKPPVVYGDGSQIRAFCFVEDASEGVSKVLTEENGVNQIFNIGNDEEAISIKDLAQKVIKISGKDLKPEFKDMEDSDREASREIYRRSPVIYQARQMLNYQPKFSLEEGIRKTIESNCIFDTWSIH